MAGGEALGAEQLVRDLPAAVERAQHVLLRHAHIDEELLGELGIAADGLDRPHGDAGRLQIDQQHGDAGVARLCLRIGADQREHPVGEVAVGGPDLVAVDDEAVAVEHRAGRKAGEVGAGAGLGIALAPRHVAGEDARQVLRLLLGRAGVDDQRADEAQAVRIRRRRADAAHLLEQDDLLRQRRAHAAGRFRPVRRDPAALVELAVPGLQLRRIDPQRPVAECPSGNSRRSIRAPPRERRGRPDCRRKRAWCCPTACGHRNLASPLSIATSPRSTVRQRNATSEPFCHISVRTVSPGKMGLRESRLDARELFGLIARQRAEDGVGGDAEARHAVQDRPRETRDLGALRVDMQRIGVAGQPENHAPDWAASAGRRPRRGHVTGISGGTGDCVTLPPNPPCLRAKVEPSTVAMSVPSSTVRSRVNWMIAALPSPLSMISLT